MNKLISKIVGAVLGVTMATGIGVGVAVGSQNRSYSKAEAADETVTINADNCGWSGSGAQSGTAVDGITVSSTNGGVGTANNVKTFRNYADATLTVTSTVGNIKSAVFTCTASGTSNYGPGKMSGTGYTYSGTAGTWSGDAASFSLTGGQSRIKTLVVTYTPSGGTTSYNITTNVTNGTYSGDTTINENGSASVTISANSTYKLPSSVTVSNNVTSEYNSTTGVVSLSNPSGAVTISATCEAAASYSITTNLSHCTANQGSATSIYEQAEATLTFTAESGYDLPSTLSPTGASVKSWDASTGVLVLNNPTGNVSLTVTATVHTNTNTSSLVPGTYFIKISNKYFTGTISSGKGTLDSAVPGSAGTFTFTLVGDDEWTVVNGNGSVLGISGTSSTNLAYGNNYTMKVIDGETSGTFMLNSIQNTARYVACYNSSDLRTYALGAQNADYEFTLESAKTLTTVTVSGSMSVTSYTTAESWDPTGLVVTGTYSDSSTDPNLASSATFTYYNSNDEQVNAPINLGAGSGQTLKVVATVAGVSSDKFVASTTISVTVVAYTNSSSLEEGTYYIKYDSYYFTGTLSGGDGTASTEKPGNDGKFVFTLIGNDTWSVVSVSGNRLGISTNTTSGFAYGNSYTFKVIDGDNGAFRLNSLDITNRYVGFYDTNHVFKTYATGNIIDMILEDVNAVEYTISYNANGGSGSAMPSTVDYYPTIAECTYTAPEGQTFVKWNTQADGEGDDYLPGARVKANLTLYAIWAINVGGDVSMSGGTAATVNGKHASKCGTGKAGGEMTITLNVANITKIKAFVAGWTSDEPTVNVSISSGTISPTELHPTSDSGITGTSTAYTLAGAEKLYSYTFIISNAPAGTTITISSSAKDNRFVVWGATDYFAESFASDFTNHLVCNSSGSSQPTYTNDYSWNAFEGIFNSLDSEEQEKLHDATYTRSGTGTSTVITATGTTSQAVAEAIAKYDYIVGKYNLGQGITSYTNFIGRSNIPVPSDANRINLLNIDNTAVMTVVSVFAVLSFTTLGGYFLLRKKKEER